MEFKEMNCPFCKGLLKVPEDLTNCVCLYCGKKIEVISTKRIEESCHEYEKLCAISIEQGSTILLKHQDLMKSFKSNLYEDAFEKYLDECFPIIQALDKACGRIPYIYGKQLSEQIYCVESEQQLVDLWITSILDNMEMECKIKRSETGKITNTKKVDENRFVLALYTIPMIRETKLEIAELVADSFIEEWGKRYPQHKFTKADYKEIRDGFKRRKLCFITTAVCDSLGKPDDCHELLAFRAFRDAYLLNSKEGTRLVEQYYDIAPSIVNTINVLSERNEIYLSIWKEYLKPCLGYINLSQEEECKQVYIEMVHTLTRTYVLA